MGTTASSIDPGKAALDSLLNQIDNCNKIERVKKQVSNEDRSSLNCDNESSIRTLDSPLNQIDNDNLKKNEETN